MNIRALTSKNGQIEKIGNDFVVTRSNGERETILSAPDEKTADTIQRLISGTANGSRNRGYQDGFHDGAMAELISLGLIGLGVTAVWAVGKIRKKIKEKKEKKLEETEE